MKSFAWLEAAIEAHMVRCPSSKWGDLGEHGWEPLYHECVDKGVREAEFDLASLAVSKIPRLFPTNHPQQLIETLRTQREAAREAVNRLAQASRDEAGEGSARCPCCRGMGWATAWVNNDWIGRARARTFAIWCPLLCPLAQWMKQRNQLEIKSFDQFPLGSIRMSGQPGQDDFMEPIIARMKIQMRRVG